MADSSPLSSNNSQSKDRQIWRDLVKGLLLIALLVVIKVVLEHTAFGKAMERSGYDWLQTQLSSSERLPLVVVDLSDLEPQEFNIDGQIGIATPRNTLRELIKAATEQKARAIGVDIDFSPGPSGYMWPRDPEFFDFCLKNEVPVFLGISRGESLSPDKWLGNEDYKDLAASMIIPNDTRKMPMWIRIGTDSEPGKTLGAALATGYQESQSGLAKWLHDFHLVEQVSEKELGHDVGVGEFPVDYSSLKTLIDKTLRTRNPVVIRDQGHLLRNKIVIFGPGTLSNSGDGFKIEGFEQRVPGVYIHASAAYTLRNAPLYELTRLSRLGIDVLLSLIVLFSVIAIQSRFSHGSTKLAKHRVHFVFTILIIIVALIFGIAFVVQTRVLWSDFILVVALLMLHVPIEHLFKKGHSGIKSAYERTKQLISAVFTEKERKTK